MRTSAAITSNALPPDPPDYRSRLEAIRDRLTDELADAEGTALAAVAKQLDAILLRLESLPNAEVSKVDELKKRRDSRRAAVPDAPAGKRGSGA